jgi:hypothetical protein
MRVTHKDLDTPINQLVEEADNPETFREFIRSTEKEFELPEADVDSMTEDQLNNYLDDLDYFWEK